MAPDSPPVERHEDTPANGILDRANVEAAAAVIKEPHINTTRLQQQVGSMTSLVAEIEEFLKAVSQCKDMNASNCKAFIAQICGFQETLSKIDMVQLEMVTVKAKMTGILQRARRWFEHQILYPIAHEIEETTTAIRQRKGRSIIGSVGFIAQIDGFLEKFSGIEFVDEQAAEAKELLAEGLQEARNLIEESLHQCYERV